jgi:hypothetical protein
MRKVRGLVLDSSKTHVILLTRGGEYVKLPSQGRFYDLGSEAAIRRPLLGLNLQVWVAAAVLLLVFSASLWHLSYNVPRAYLALDINPSLTLFLNSHGRVFRAQPHNLQARGLLAYLDVRGKPGLKALELILEESRLQEYLSPREENMVFLSLAGPAALLDEKEVKARIIQVLLELEVDAYLRVNSCGLEKGEQALDRGVSLNAHILAEQMGQGNGKEPGQPGPPPTVREFLSTFKPDFKFSNEEFVPGRRQGGKPANPPGRP